MEKGFVRQCIAGRLVVAKPGLAVLHGLLLLSAGNTAAARRRMPRDCRAWQRCSRSPVASHWKTDYIAAIALIDRTMEISAGGKKPSPTLRRAMLTVMNSRDQSYRHPLFWAPFVLVGESGHWATRSIV